MTTEQATRVVPAGWYQDPANPDNVRWWNGITWTDHVELKPTGQQAASAGALALEGGAAAEARAMERQHGITTAENDIIMSAAHGDSQAGKPRTGTIAIVGPQSATSTGTISSWLLAVTPVIALLLTLIAGYLFFYVTPTPIVAVVAVVVYILGFLWAIGDSRTLATRGHQIASPLWTLALPVLGPLLYLINRRRRAPGSSPLVAFLVLLAITAGIPLAGIASGSAVVVTKALEVQQAVRADLVGTGAATSVTCPPVLESVAAGTVFTCNAVIPSGDTVHVWVSFDNDQGQFSWALANR